MNEVQVFIPVYNDVVFLSEAIASVTSQEDVEVEVVIVDNASTDGTTELAREAAEADSRVRVIRHEENIGMLPNFNSCIAAATSPFFMMLCSDDYLRGGRALKAALEVCADNEVVSVYCDLEYVDSHGDRLGQRDFHRSGEFDPEAAMRSSIRMNRNLFGIPLIHRTEFLKNLTYLDSMPYTGDLYMSYEMAQFGKVYHLPEPLIANRFTGGNATASLVSKTRREMINMAKVIEFDLSWLDRAISQATVLPTILAKVIFLKVAGLRTTTDLKGEVKRIIRFALVGVFNTLFGYGLYLGFLFAGLPYWAAWGAALVISLFVGFLLSGRYVFQESSRKSMFLYFASWGLIYLMNIALLWGLIGAGLSEKVAPFVVLPVNVLASFLLQKLVVFRP